MERFPTAREALHLLKEELEKAGIQDADAESRIILEWICGIDRVSYFMDQNALISPEKAEELQEVLKKRTKRIPLQYLMRTTEFMGLPFYVDERVLIPRPDTECLVEYALELLKGMEASDKTMNELRVLDLCTGSGCIGISISKFCPDARVTLADISEEALEVAERNADHLHARAELVRGDLFEALKADMTKTGAVGRTERTERRQAAIEKAGRTERTERRQAAIEEAGRTEAEEANRVKAAESRKVCRFHMIVSNPPYIPTGTIGTLMPEVKDYEPVLALDGKEDGLAFYRRIISEAGDYLYPGGWLLFEIGMDQGEDLRKLFEQAGYRDVTVRQDLAGLDRIAAGRLPETD